MDKTQDEDTVAMPEVNEPSWPEAERLGKFDPGDFIDGNYEVLRWLGSGGMGNVYLVRHKIMLREFALKTLNVDRIDTNAWSRFQNEARALAKLDHPNIVTIYNFGVHKGMQPFYVMDYLDGESLAELLERSGRLPPEQVAFIFREICRGLESAHKRDIIHRDIKPSNIIVSGVDRPSVKIVDFGLVKLRSSNQQHLTKTGEVFGSPYYMSPEQACGQPVDSRSDLYSLGCSLFECLSGRPPYRGENALATLMMHQVSATPSLSGGPAVEAFQPLIERLMAKSKDERFQSADLVGREFDHILLTGHALSAGSGMTVASASGSAASGKAGHVHDRSRSSKSVHAHNLSDESSQEAPTANKLGGLRSNLILLATLLFLAGLILVAAYSIGKKSAPQKNATNSDLFSLSENQRFLTGLSIDGSQMLYQFPDDIDIGQMQYIDPSGKVINVKLHGQQEFPVAQDKFFTPGADFIKYAQYRKSFSQGDFNGITLVNDTGPEAFDIASRFPGVSKVSLWGCSAIKAADLRSLQNIKQLRMFNFSSGGFNADDVAALPYLEGVESFTCMNEKNTDKLMARIGKLKTQSLSLFLTGSTVSSYGFTQLARQSNLENLDLSGAKFSFSDLARLSSCGKLGKLTLGGLELNSDAVAALVKLKTLRTITLVGGPKNAAYWKQIYEQLPGVELIQVPRN